MSYRNPLLMIVGPLVGVVAGCSDYAVQDVREQEESEDSERELPRQRGDLHGCVPFVGGDDGSARRCLKATRFPRPYSAACAGRCVRGSLLTTAS